MHAVRQMKLVLWLNHLYFFQSMVKELVKWYFVQPQVPFLLGALEIYLSPHVSEKKIIVQL